MGAGTLSVALHTTTDIDDSHIVLETLGGAPEAESRGETVSARFDLKSLFRATRLRLTLYEEGLLQVDVDYRNTRRTSRTLDLRYLDPRPRISRIVSKRPLYCCAAAAGLAALFMSLAGAGLLSSAEAFAPAFAASAASGIFGWLFLCRSGEQSVFRTRNGHADVLVLFATLGSIHTIRRIVPAIVTAIRDASGSASDKNAALRSEIREHYRLVKAGAISQEECTTCTQRILQQFG